MQADTTDPEALLSALAADDVVETVDDEVRLTDTFRKRRERLRTDLANDEATIDDALRTACETVATEVDDELVSTAAAVAAATSFDAETAAASALALGRIEQPPTDDRTPDGFTAIRGEEIEAFLARNPTSVLYFWGEDCESCSVVKSDLEELQEEGRIPDHVGLAAVCGDDCYQLIRDRYDVAVAPTTVFCADGRPDSRLIGAHNKETVASEIDIIAGTDE